MMVEVSGRPEVARILKRIVVLENRGWMASCKCCGDPTLEFFEGERLEMSIGVHHTKLLRWEDGAWLSDEDLTPESAAWLKAWLRELEQK